MKIIFICPLLCIAILLQGCAGAIIGGATATSIAVVHDRRSAGTVIDDRSLAWEIQEAIANDEALYSEGNVNVTVYNKTILLTGETPTETLKSRAQSLAEQIAPDKKIFNEIALIGPSSLLSRSEDTYITTKVKLALFNVDIAHFDPTRVKVITEDNTVFLMGLLTPQEADAVTEQVRTVGGVQKVIRLFEYIQP